MYHVKNGAAFPILQRNGECCLRRLRRGLRLGICREFRTGGSEPVEADAAYGIQTARRPRLGCAQTYTAGYSPQQHSLLDLWFAPISLGRNQHRGLPSQGCALTPGRYPFLGQLEPRNQSLAAILSVQATALKYTEPRTSRFFGNSIIFSKFLLSGIWTMNCTEQWLRGGIGVCACMG